ncbi:extracellular solute-binding protein [Cohnella panacarvi]|uniref:ABC transporter substrate-binding protein n=1 Tax=Cohnella panacarvi TaxID=400776 RepID=UPI00047B979F|nr:extracellular solute-binding protein [Cohnella panacarvi]
MNHDDHWEKQLQQLPLGNGGFSVESMNKIKERIRLNRTTRLRSARIAVAAVSIVSVAAVAWAINRGMQPQQVATEPRVDETEAQLIVQYWDNQSFMNQIGQPYMIRHPNIDFKIVTSQSNDLASYRKWLEESNADVLQIPLAYIDDLAKDGAIIPLDDMLKRDRVDLDEMYQPMIELMREAGGGKLYALVDQFSTDLLFYNKTLFQRHRVPLPDEGDTWDDIFRLAGRFDGSTEDGKPVYGLSFGWRSDPYNAIMKVGRSEGLSLVDAKGLPQVDSDAWHKVWSQVTEGFGKGWINNEPGPAASNIGWTEESIMKADTFINNRAAMSLQSYNSSWNFISKAIEKGIFTGDWDALPVSSSTAPEVTRSFGGAIIYAINAKSPNKDQAMKLIEYIVSKEQSERDYVSGNFPLHANRATSVSIANDPADRVYAAKLDADTILEQLERNQLPGVLEMSAALNAKGTEAAQSIIAGRTTVEETLSQLQEEAVSAIQSSGRTDGLP